jgi:hypothetical protein
LSFPGERISGLEADLIMEVMIGIWSNATIAYRKAG